MITDVLADGEDRMKKAIEVLQNDLRSISTGRASPALVERLKVDYYSVPTPLLQLSTISAEDAETLAIRPYAANDIGAIERSIALSDLGLTPSNDGQVIRLKIPRLTEERRLGLTKRVGARAEEARVAVRNIRRDVNDELRKMEKNGDISEDDFRRGQDQVQEKTDAFIKQVNDVAKDKEAEIMTI